MKPHGEPHRTNLRRGKAPVTALGVAHNRKAGVQERWRRAPAVLALRGALMTLYEATLRAEPAEPAEQPSLGAL